MYQFTYQFIPGILREPRLLITGFRPAYMSVDGEELSTGHMAFHLVWQNCE